MGDGATVEAALGQVQLRRAAPQPGVTGMVASAARCYARS
jgi:hypothetical protein